MTARTFFVRAISVSIIYQLKLHDSFCLCLASVHLPYPFHLVFSFQLFGHTVSLCQLRYDQLHAVSCRFINLGVILSYAHQPMPLLLLSAKSLAPLACSVVNALAAVRCRYQLFAGLCCYQYFTISLFLRPLTHGSKLYIACSAFLQKSELTHAAAPPFRKKSRSARLLGCKRPRCGSLSLTTFCAHPPNNSHPTLFSLSVKQSWLCFPIKTRYCEKGWIPLLGAKHALRRNIGFTDERLFLFWEIYTVRTSVFKRNNFIKY